MMETVEQCNNTELIAAVTKMYVGPFKVHLKRFIFVPISRKTKIQFVK
jgi:hypothetical protein